MFWKRKSNPQTWYDAMWGSARWQNGTFSGLSDPTLGIRSLRWTSTMDIHHPRIIGLCHMCYPAQCAPELLTLVACLVIGARHFCNHVSCVCHVLSCGLSVFVMHSSVFVSFSSFFDGQKTCLIVFVCWWTLLPVVCLLLVTLVCPKTGAWSRGGEGEWRGVENQLKNLINALLFKFLSCVWFVLFVSFRVAWAICGVIVYFTISELVLKLYVWVCFDHCFMVLKYFWKCLRIRANIIIANNDDSTGRRWRSLRWQNNL